MPELSLQSVFGAHATQTATAITIAKADLAGLTGTSTNSPDQIVVGLQNLWSSAYPQSVRDANKNVSIVNTLGAVPSTSGDFTVTPNVAYMVYTYSTQVYVLLPSTSPTPGSV